ncbi:hypothetical protein PFICI_02222 [Pestalotiopsis fici W106-1]|uniref:Uncharacterized protein n=1 Tax=Pestalotiopsis fici (strain W106-1 / CGMCC3.15140) TaxID=1229662 RepID=W3XFJ7_PESFW|nr:uncharacterized protein PFICI_02222 [Pestalotiopsis fici W106-1]ETS84197.1 hypothetical protein PFICI_02222 [Pestalotiopsis fici W106-1]
MISDHFFDPKARGPGWRRLVFALDQTVNEFLDSALVFAAAMLGATIARYYIFLTPTDARLNEVWTYTLMGSALMSTFSVFPCIVLQTITSVRNSHYQRLFLWFMVAAFIITVQCVFQITFYEFFEYPYLGDYNYHDGTWSANDPWFQEQEESGYTLGGEWEQYYRLLRNVTHVFGSDRTMIVEKYCGNPNITKVLREVVTVGFSLQAPVMLFCLIAALVALILALPMNLPRLKDLQTRCADRLDKRSHAMNFARFCLGLIYLVMTWLFLVEFVRARRQVKDIAGGTDEDSNWSFGQILALAQWVPIALHVISKFKHYPESYEAIYHFDEDARSSLPIRRAFGP